MSKTIVLVVSGEMGCGVIDFEDYNEEHNLDVAYWAKKKVNSDIKYIVVLDDDYNFSIDYYEFDSIDSNFIELIRSDIQDYDNRKNIDFFVEGIDFFLDRDE